MAEIVSTSASVTSGTASGIVLALASAGTMPLDPHMIGGVLCGALIFLMRSREEHKTRRVIYFLLSLPIGYSTASWLVLHWPNAPPSLLGLASGALIVLVAINTIDWASAALPGLFNQLSQIALDRIRTFFGGGKNG